MSAKILIVDDEEGLAFVLRQALLLDFPGCQVDAAHSGEEGLSRLAEACYDLIIADYHMPGFDGLDLIRGVRYLDGNVPIILMTGYGSAATRASAKELAVDYYFEKPFKVDEMLAAVRQLLAGKGEDGG